MHKKFALLLVLSLAVACFVASPLLAQDTAGDPKARLNEVRNKKALATTEYQNELAELNMDAEQKVDVVKKEFHAKRDVILKERDDRRKELLVSYKANIAPLTSEEKELIARIGPAEGGNFAKPKSERQGK